MSGPGAPDPAGTASGRGLDAVGLTAMVEVGRGAFATVYRARQEGFARDVAVKVINDPMTDEHSQVSFRRECQTLGTASAHPNVVSVFASGLDHLKRPYLVMEYCSGGSLSSLIERHGPLPFATTVDFAVKLSGALAFAHSKQLLHRDIKPANVLLTQFGEPVLSDFGIAADSAHLTETIGGAMTPLYSSPEVLSSGGGSERSDVYSLASTIWCMLLGRAPFSRTAAGIVPLLERMRHGTPEPIHRSDLPAGLVDLLMESLAPDPAERVPSATVLADRLVALRSRQAAPVPAPSQAPPAAPPPPPGPPAGWTPVPPAYEPAVVTHPPAGAERAAPPPGLTYSPPGSAPADPAQDGGKHKTFRRRRG